MNVSQEEFQNMKEEIIKDMIAFRMEDSGCTMQEPWGGCVFQGTVMNYLENLRAIKVRRPLSISSSYPRV